MHDSNGIFFIKSGEAIEIMPIAIDENTGRAKNMVFSSTPSSSDKSTTGTQNLPVTQTQADEKNILVPPPITPPRNREMSNEEVLDAQKRRRRRMNKSYQIREENIRKLDVELTVLSVHDVCGEYPLTHNFHKKHHVDVRAQSDMIILHAGLCRQIYF